MEVFDLYTRLLCFFLKYLQETGICNNKNLSVITKCLYLDWIIFHCTAKNLSTINNVFSSSLA